MPMGLPGTRPHIAKKVLTAPPIFLAILGILLLFIGVIIDISLLISLGVSFTILGFVLSILWQIIRGIFLLEKKKS
jgi:uncharacterized membrane protein HdeD (DUF308 family)